MSEGIVYILTNAAMPGFIKIGLTQQDDVSRGTAKVPERGELMRRLIPCVLLWTLAACSEPVDKEQEFLNSRAEMAAAETARLAAEKAATPPTEMAVSLSERDQGRICRAAIATVMGRDPSVIRVIGSQSGIVDVRYTRDDGTIWTNRCRVEAGRVTWAAVENNRPGRWRTEDSITYRIEGDEITITESMMGTQTFTLP